MKSAAMVSAVAGFAAAAAGDTPRIVNIGAPPGHVSRVTAMNADGTMAVSWRFRWTSPDIWEDLGPGTLCTGPFPGRSLTGISGDGSVVVGNDLMFSECERAFRWTATGGIQDLGQLPGGEYNTGARAVSADGRVIVGYAMLPFFHRRAVRWTEAGGMEALGELQTTAWAVSADGSVIAGGQVGSAWRWTEATGMQLIPRLPNETRCIARAVSADGSTIAGRCWTVSAQHRPFKWRESIGTVALPYDIGWQGTEVYALRGDGEIAVGRFHSGTYRAAIWIGTEVFDLNDFLPVLGVNLTGWVLTDALEINARGDVIGGVGTFNGATRGWIVYLAPPCYANCDGSTGEPILNVDDFTCFINEFAAASALPPAQQIMHYANCDGSTTAPVLNVNDFTCFINAFAAGCP